MTDETEPAPPAQIPPSIRFHAPARAAVTLHCPNCGEDVALEATFGTRLVRDSDGSTTLALRTRAPKIAHSCDQLSLELEGRDRVATGPLAR